MTSRCLTGSPRTLVRFINFHLLSVGIFTKLRTASGMVQLQVLAHMLPAYSGLQT